MPLCLVILVGGFNMQTTWIGKILKPLDKLIKVAKVTFLVVDLLKAVRDVFEKHDKEINGTDVKEVEP